MEFLVISVIAATLSVGLAMLLFPDSFSADRLSEARRRGLKGLREAFVKAAAAAGKRLSYLRTAKQSERVQMDIYSALSVLRNHASAGSQSGGAMSACVTTDYLLEQFSAGDGPLKEAYIGALRLLRTGRRHEAAEFFAAAAGVPFARDFILLVLDWDAVPSYKLKKTVVAYQTALKEVRTTELMRKNEVLSDLVYMPVITGVLVIFVNFIYVAYFAEQQSLLAELFF